MCSKFWLAKRTKRFEELRSRLPIWLKTDRLRLRTSKRTDWRMMTSHSGGISCWRRSLCVHDQVLVIVGLRREHNLALSLRNAHVARFRVATHLVSYVHLLRAIKREYGAVLPSQRASPFPSSSSHSPGKSDSFAPFLCKDDWLENNCSPSHGSFTPQPKKSILHCIVLCSILHPLKTPDRDLFQHNRHDQVPTNRE